MTKTLQLNLKNKACPRACTEYLVAGLMNRKKGTAYLAFQCIFIRYCWEFNILVGWDGDLCKT